MIIRRRVLQKLRSSKDSMYRAPTAHFCQQPTRSEAREAYLSS